MQYILSNPKSNAMLKDWQVQVSLLVRFSAESKAASWYIFDVGIGTPGWTDLELIQLKELFRKYHLI